MLFLLPIQSALVDLSFQRVLNYNKIGTEERFRNIHYKDNK